jgi:hypothetical protein
MLWTYRIFRDSADRYSIREVLYENDGTLISYGKQPVEALGSSLEDLLQLIHWFQEAFESPILSTETIEAELNKRSNALENTKPLSDRSDTFSLQEVIDRLNPALTQNSIS